MVSPTSFFSSVAALAVAVQHVSAHGYMYIPLAEFTDTATSAWIVQIDPQWTGDWDSCSSSDSDCLTTLYTSLKSSNGYSDIRTLLDSDTSLYGADCGYTNPDATAKDPPTTGDATFSRGMVHVGPCEIWLDDTMVLSNDDCMTAYGDGTQDTASVFTPVDYSSCSTSGCMLRFYWLAFQGVDSSMVWQVYKDCVPLTGPASGDGSSTSTTTASSTTSETTSSTTGDEAATSTTGTSTTESSATTGTTTTSSSAAATGESTTGTSTTESSATTGTSYTESSATTGTESSAATGTSYTESSATTGGSSTTTSSAATGGGSWTSESSATTGGASWTSTGSATTSSMTSGGSSATAWTSGSSNTNTNSGVSGSNTQGNGNQGGNGWSGGFGGMGGGLRK
jgi:hypothetical protein